MATLTAVFEQDGDFVTSWFEEFPGPLGQGRTINEAREDLLQTTHLMLEMRRSEMQSDGLVVLAREAIEIRLS
jgi:predicted RNase H-like HicB family nuclease